MNNAQRAERTDFEIMRLRMLAIDSGATSPQIQLAVAAIEPSTTSDQIKVRACSIVCNAHPEYGTFGVMHDHGDYYSIHGRAGWAALWKSEADKYWSVVQH